MARRIIVCDGAETARLWSRTGAADNEELTWVPREKESRARPPGFRVLQGGLTADAFRKLDPEPDDEYALATDDGPWIRAAVPAIRDRMETLERVGLSYIHVGQQATTLSGGEAQRVKLSKELSQRATGRTLYILDEPTTGLHFHDVARLIDVLVRLRDANNTLIVIEHNMDIIKSADWVIDLGPEGGNDGGRIVAEGPPERIAAAPDSHTGRFLATALGMEHLLQKK